MNFVQLRSKSNLIGTMASSLCLIHCMVTPFLFAAQAGLVTHGKSHPFWWGTLDIAFLIISYFAVLWSSKTTSKHWMRLALWASWGLLALTLLNEKLSFFHLVEEAIYVPSLSLVFFHLYNRKYCRCDGDECCIHSEKT